MTRLPDASALGQRPQLQTSTVVPMRLGQEEAAERQTGQAISQFGQQVFEIGQRVQEREDKLNYVQQKSLFLQKGLEFETSLEGDTDYKTFGPRWVENMEKVKKEALEKIQNPLMREQFEVDASLDIQQGVSRMAAKSWGMEKDNGRATLFGTVDRNRELSIRTNDEAVRISLLKNTQNAIQVAKENGYISAENAEELSRKSAEDYAIARISVLPPEERLRLLDESGGIADVIPSDTKEILKDKAESESLTNLRNLEWVNQQARENLYNEISLAIEQTGGLSQVPPDKWSMLDKSQRDALKSYAKNIAEGNQIPTDWDTYYELKTKAANPETRKKFEREDLTKYRNKLGTAEYKELIGLQSGIREGKKDKSLDGFRTHKQIVDDTLNSVGIDPTPKPGDKAKQVSDFRRMVDEQIQQRQEVTGKEVTNQEVQEIVDNLIVKGRVPESGFFFDDEKRRFQLESGEKIVVEDVKEVPRTERQKIEDALRRRGSPVNDDTVLELYNRKLSRE